jgi:hypothetical protein
MHSISRGSDYVDVIESVNRGEEGSRGESVIEGGSDFGDDSVG